VQFVFSCNNPTIVPQWHRSCRHVQFLVVFEVVQQSCYHVQFLWCDSNTNIRKGTGLLDCGTIAKQKHKKNMVTRLCYDFKYKTKHCCTIVARFQKKCGTIVARFKKTKQLCVVTRLLHVLKKLKNKLWRDCCTISKK
jgi:hypothetical protein